MSELAECVRLPLVPVTVNVEVPTGVVLPVVTVIVEVPLVVTVAGEKLALAALGIPLALRVTVPANPFSAPMVTVYVVEFPAITVCVEGETAMEKSGTTTVATTKLTVVECARAPLVPVMVSVDVPASVLVEVVTVIVEVPLVVTVAGENLALAPAGKTVALSVTVPVKPFNAPMVTV